MAIRYHQVSIVKAQAGSAVHGLQAYIDRSISENPTTGEVYDFRHKAGEKPVAARGCVGPAGDLPLDARTVWDAAMKREMTLDRKTGEWRLKRGNGGEGTAPQIAKHRIVAIPKEFTDAEKLEFARDYAAKIAEENGTFASFAVHLDEQKNPHVHIIESIRTFSVDADGTPRFGNKARKAFSANQLIDKDEPMQHFVAFTEKWAAERGLEIRWNNATPPVTDEAKKALASDLYSVSEKLTRNSATFTRRELEKSARADFFADENDLTLLLEHDDLIEVEEGVFTTRAIIEQRKEMVETASRLALAAPVNEKLASKIADELTFRDDQKAAFKHTLKSRFAIVQGDPGTGKSHMLRGVADYHRSTTSGRIIALAPTNQVKAALQKDLKLDGGDRARTLHAELFKKDKASGEFVPRKTDWKRDDLIVVDEAAMIDDVRFSALIKEADRTGAKLVLVGDDKQLKSVERGGLYSEIRTKIGSGELTEITRQLDADDRAASKAMARGHFRQAVSHYAKRGAITGADGPEKQREAAVIAWSKGPRDRAFIYAGTNKTVDALNVAAQKIRRDAGELGKGREVELFGEKKMILHEGDQVQLRVNNREQDYMNGHLGRVVALGEKIAIVELDDKRLVEADLKHIALGYAGTTYRGQGQTNRAAYVVHEAGVADRALTLVALTRHKEKLQIFVDKNTTKNQRELVKQMSRERSKSRLLSQFDLSAHDRARSEKLERERLARVEAGKQAPARAPAQNAAAKQDQPAGKEPTLDELRTREKKLSERVEKIDAKIEAKSGFFKSWLNRAELADLKLQRATLDDERRRAARERKAAEKIAAAEAEALSAQKPTPKKATIEPPHPAGAPRAPALPSAKKTGEAQGGGADATSSGAASTPAPGGARERAIAEAVAKQEAEAKSKAAADAERARVREEMREMMERAARADTSNERLKKREAELGRNQNRRPRVR